MNKSDKLSELLKKVLTPDAEPSEELNKEIIRKIQEVNTMKSVSKRRGLKILVAATLTFAMSITAFAALKILNPKDVAEHLGYSELGRAFESEDAIKINESRTAGGYEFNFLGIVSGEGLSEIEGYTEEVKEDKTYGVVSIEKEDGSKMPDTMDEEYGQIPFFISPLIKGQEPWKYNIVTMGGGYSETVIDGVMYRIFECDGIEMFSDRGLYLAISTGAFYDINAFNYSEETGEISINTSYDGASALFDLPLNIGKADYEKAERYIKDLQEEWEKDSNVEEIDIDANFTVIPESIEEITLR